MILRVILGGLIPLLVCLTAFPVWAASAIQQAATMVTIDASAATSFAISFASTPTPGNAVVMVGCIFNGDLDYTITGVTDNQSGNTYTTRSGVATRIADRGYAFIAHAPNVNASGTFTTTVSLTGSSAGVDVVLGLLEISGLATSLMEDQVDSNNDIDVGGTTDVSAGATGATTQNDEMAIGAATYVGGNAALAWSSPGSYTNRYRENNASAHAGCDVATRNLSTTGTQTLQWAHTNSALAEGTGLVVTLKDASGPPVGSLMFMGVGR